jgi:hypothetical protein
MFVGSHCEFMAAAQAAAFEHSAPIGRGHALAEAMHTHAAADFRLIRTFGHSSFLISK